MEKRAIKKSDWQANFYLLGQAKVNDNTFKINEQPNRSNWIYNSMNLGVDCSEKYGIIYTDFMGGYSADGNNVIYCHGKDENGKDDYSKQIIVSFEDRFNKEVLEEVGEMCFIIVGLELTDKNYVYEKKFLSIYDAIEYIKEYIKDGMTVSVSGKLNYSEYNGQVQVKRNITKITLPMDRNKKIRDVTSDEYKATFTQSILIDKDSASLKNIDKDKGVMYVDARVLDYVKEINGVEVKGQYPYNKQFEFAMDFSNEAKCKMIVDKLFKVKKDKVTQINFEGEFIESGSVIAATWDDVPDDIKDLVEMDIYTKEEALAKCVNNGSKERRMVLKKPVIKMVGEGEVKTPVVQMFPERYEEDDLVLDYIYNKSTSDLYDIDVDVEDGSDEDDEMSWLNNL